MRRTRRGFSLIEMLLVVALLGVLAAAALTAAQPSTYDTLQAGSRLLVADLSYARSLAVANNSNYTLTFNRADNRYTLTHSGTNTALNTLPTFALRSHLDTATQRIVDLDELPHLKSGLASLAAVGTMGASPAPATTITFGPLGETSSTVETAIWFSAGSGSNQRYVAVRVDPVSGLTTIDPLSATGPPTSIVGN